MGNIETVLVLLFITSTLSILAKKIGVAHEILLVLSGLVIGFIPGLQEVKLAPDIVFLILLPPLLSSAAYYTSWAEFRAHIRPIFLLAIGAVIFTTCAVAIVVKSVIPGLGWGFAFLLGAIVSPPDATALVAFRFALAAILTGSFSFLEASAGFIFVSTGGVCVGLGMGWLSAYIRKKIHDSAVENIIGILVPFFAYILAEHSGVSGVIATVTAGLYTARINPEITTADARRKSFALWEVLVFIVNGIAFILIGLQLPSILRGISVYPTDKLILSSAVISVTVIIARFVWIFPGTYLPRFFFSGIRKRESSPSMRGVIVTSWAGMRGIVSIAAAMAIPEYDNDGIPFPNRDLLIFLTYVTVLVTLVVPALTLPFLIRYLKLKSEDNTEKQEILARIECAEAGLNFLETYKADETNIPEEINFLKQEYAEKLTLLKMEIFESGMDALLKRKSSIRNVRVKAIESERKKLIQLRNNGMIHDHILFKIQAELDMKELGIRKI
ncbi:MAG: cation:proton antiporter [Leptospira sp.]|nr:cation:proton antiporter [Leptospira sp.]